jgi:hypothetical protein
VLTAQNRLCSRVSVIRNVRDVLDLMHPIVLHVCHIPAATLMGSVSVIHSGPVRTVLYPRQAVGRVIRNVWAVLALQQLTVCNVPQMLVEIITENVFVTRTGPEMIARHL